MLFCLKFLQINGRILRRNLHFIETKCHAEKMCFPGMAFFIVLILILQQKNDSLDLPFYFTLSFFCCFRNANSLLGKRSTAGCFCLIKPKKSRIFGFFQKESTAQLYHLCSAIMETHVTNDTMHTRKAKGVRSAPHSTSNFLHQLRPIFQNKHDFSISMHHCSFYSSQPQLCIKFRQHPILSA